MTLRGTIARMACAALAAAAVIGESPAQFGHFGKNKVIYEDFDWHVYRAPHFDVYYYPEEAQFLEQVVSYAESSFLYLSKALDHEPKFRIPLIFYRNHGHFEQTNISLGFIDPWVGAFAEPLERRMVLPVDHPDDFLYELLTHELTHIFEYSILFDEAGGRALRGGAPPWLMEGLASHLAKDESTMDLMIIRDAAVNNLVATVQQLGTLNFLTYRVGQAVFEFIDKEFGPEGIRSFLAEYRKVLLSGNIEKAIKESFGVEAEEFGRRFRRYLMKKYVPILLENNEPEDHGRQIGTKLPAVWTASPTLSPSGDLIASLALTDEFDLIIINAKDGEMVRNLTKGLTNEWDYLITAFFSGKNDVSWSPLGDEVAVFARKSNRRLLLVFNAVTGKRVHHVELEVDEAESPAFSPDGKRIAFEANRNGQVDIFEYNLETKQLSNITNDTFFDSNPAWSADGKTILYNRRINAYEKIFLLDYEDPAQKTQVTFGETSDIQPSFSRDGKRIYYSSDAGEHGIFNIYSMDLETGEIKQFTDVVSGHFSPQELPERDGKGRLVTTAYWQGRYRLYTVDLDKPVAVIKPEERVQEPQEIVPFSPSLQLTLDEAEKRPYDKISFHLEGGSDTIGVGVASDGTVIGNAYILFSDLLGDHRIWVYAQSVASFGNFEVGYIRMKDRLQWFGAVSDYRDFFIAPTVSGDVVREQANRVTALRGGIMYPFSTNTRIETTLGVTNRDVLGTLPITFEDPNSGAEFGLLAAEADQGTSPYATFSVVNDTTRFREFGAWHGKRINFSVRSAPVASGDLGTFTEYSLDFRAYGKMTRRSLFAWRTVGIVGTGEGSQFFGIGGLDQIRGFLFRELFGDRASFMNLEFRFPLVDDLRFPFGSIRQIRGIVFLDVGASWTQEGLFWDKDTGIFREFEFWDSDEDRLRDGRASYGLGFSFRMGGLNLNWTFARRFPFTETTITPDCIDAFVNATSLEGQVLALGSCPLTETKDSGFRSEFYIGVPF